MKLSELLEEHPNMDVDLGEKPGRLFLDGTYLFRVIDRNDKPGDCTVLYRVTDHTDGIVWRGLLTSTLQASDNWGSS